MNEQDKGEQLLNTSFSLEGFEEAFRDELRLRSLPTFRGKKVRGKSPLVKLELALDVGNRLLSATLVFPFFLKDAEANRSITAQAVRFLELCLPDRVMPEDWMQEATQALKKGGQRLFEHEYDGIVISLFQMESDLIFVLQAERKEALKRPRSRPATPS